MSYNRPQLRQTTTRNLARTIAWQMKELESRPKPKVKPSRDVMFFRDAMLAEICHKYGDDGKISVSTLAATRDNVVIEAYKDINNRKIIIRVVK